MAGTSGSIDSVVTLILLLACAENAPKPSSAKKTAAKAINRLTKKRRLKETDSKVDFFFMTGYDATGG